MKRIVFYIGIMILAGCSAFNPEKLERTHYMENETSKRVFHYDNQNFKVSHHNELSKKEVILNAISNGFKESSVASQDIRIETKIAKNHIKFYHKETFNNFEEHTVAKYKISLANDGDQIKAVIQCPDYMKEVRSNTKNAFDRQVGMTVSAAKTNFKTMCQKIDPVIEWNNLVRGNVNTAFKPSQFKNEMLSQLQQFEVSTSKDEFKMHGDTKVYKLPLESKNIEVAINVFPYLDGGRVFYSFKNQYKLFGDGTTTYNPEETEQIENRLKNTLKKVIVQTKQDASFEISKN